MLNRAGNNLIKTSFNSFIVLLFYSINITFKTSGWGPPTGSVRIINGNTENFYVTNMEMNGWGPGEKIYADIHLYMTKVIF